MNKAMIMGRVTKDLELQHAGSKQQSFLKFTLAVDRMNDETDFISCTAFGKTAEAIAEHSAKGKRLAVEGRIQTGSYKKRDGSTVYITDVIVDRCDIIDWTDKNVAQITPPQQQPLAYQQGYQAAMQNPPPQFQQTVQSAQMAPQYQQPPQFQQQTMTQYQQPAPPQDGWMQAPPQDDLDIPFA